MLGSFLILLLLFNLNDFANGCVCSEMARKEIYEMSDFVSRVRIVAKTDNPTNLIYKVEHLQVFKPKEHSLDTQIFTPIFETACGVLNLEVGKEYLLGGYNRGNKLRINFCQAFTETDPGYGNGALSWESVDLLLQKQLENGDFKH